MYIILKGIEKILFVSVLRILLICKFLNFTAVFTKNKTKLSRVAYDFPCEKANFPVGPLTSKGRLLNVHIGPVDVQKGRSMDI